LVELFRAFRVEKADPDRLYRPLARDSVRQVERHQELENKLVLDVGGGAGYFTNAFREAGARCVLIEPQLPHDGGIDNLATRHNPGRPVCVDTPPTRRRLEGAVISDGYHLPFAESTADVCFSSNVLEHVPDPKGFIAEMARVTKPGGIIYVAYTNWYSPWGGHGTSPWHYLGGEWALNRYKRVNGREPINRYGETLFAVHVGSMLRWARGWPAVEVVEAAPRYYPDWCNWIVRVPGLREIATWNLMLIMRRRKA
jgi:SAM-dependent methyltransferase